MVIDSSIEKYVATNRERWIKLESEQKDRIRTNFKAENESRLRILPLLDFQNSVVLIYMIPDDLESWFKGYYQSRSKNEKEYNAQVIERALLKDGIRGLNFADDDYDFFMSHIYPYNYPVYSAKSSADFLGYNYSPDDSFNGMYYVEVLFDSGLDMPKGNDNVGYSQRYSLLSLLRERYELENTMEDKNEGKNEVMYQNINRGFIFGRSVIGILAAVVVVLISVIALLSKDKGEKISDTDVAYNDYGQYEETNQGFDQLPSDSKQYEYETDMPVDLFGLETFYGEPAFKVGAMTDTFGNENNQAYLKMTNRGDDEFSYLLNGEYNTLSGILLWSKEYKNDDRGWYSLMFYDGDRLLYTTSQCSRISGPVEFSADISNVQILTVKIDGFSNKGPFLMGMVVTAQK